MKIATNSTWLVDWVLIGIYNAQSAFAETIEIIYTTTHKLYFTHQQV